MNPLLCRHTNKLETPPLPYEAAHLPMESGVVRRMTNPKYTIEIDNVGLIWQAWVTFNHGIKPEHRGFESADISKLLADVSNALIQRETKI